MGVSYAYPQAILPRYTLKGAFSAENGRVMHFTTGRIRYTDVARTRATADEVDVRKWPGAARIALILISSLVMWLGIAALLGLMG